MITVLFFAQLQEEVGAPSIEIAADGLTVAEIKTKYLAQYEMDELLETAMVAINEEYAPEDATVSNGDVLAFIPPVSGG